MSKAGKKKSSPQAVAVNDLTHALCRLLGLRMLVLLAYTPDDQSFCSLAGHTDIGDPEFADFLESAAKALRANKPPPKKNKTTRKNVKGATRA